MTTLETLLGDPETAGVWNLVRGRSTITFKNRAMWGLMAVSGTFTDFSGDGQITRKGAVFGRLDIRAASLQTGIRRRDDHLRSPDFFDVERFGDISAVVTAVQPTTGNAANLRTSLTIKGTTVPVELPALVNVLDDGAVRISATTTIDRTDFGVGGNLAGMVRKTTTLSADAMFTRAPQ
jgi:polyisoprenoid-binding protein YceI